MSKSVRLNLVIPLESMAKLNLDSMGAGVQKSEYIRRALSLMSYVQREQEDYPNHELAIVDRDGEVIKQLIVL